jgi:hypothetical protein
VGGSFSSDLAALSNPLATRGGALEGRKFENRLSMALAGGGTRKSEAAVEAGLAWLAEHQFEDGGWRFNLESHPRCAGYCRDSGTYKSTTAATGLALLSFLGAGYTNQEGKYQDVVERGLYYLVEHQNITSRGGDLRDLKSAPETQAAVDMLGAGLRLPMFVTDTMYSHGIATLADGGLCDDERQVAAAAGGGSGEFIIKAQYDDGGWRYAPKWETPGPGDMTVTGWQLMAFPRVRCWRASRCRTMWLRASSFIDTLQEQGGRRDLYLAQERRGTPATTAIGLLCRMIGGWPRESRPLQQGTSKIGDQVPSQNNMYFNYYASQVLHHLGGPRWEKWNPKMREYLVETQSHEGHEEGSWYFSESHSTPGGRLYTTTMAIMTLEVYYRYMPLYKEAFVERSP